MYSELWSRGLRQGDVVGKIALPLLGTEFEVVAPSRSLVEPPVSGLPPRILVPSDSCFIVVVSHDCEFNEGKRNKLLVARLQSMPGHFTPDQKQDLRVSNDLEARVAAKLTVAGVDNWVFDPLTGAFDVEQVANFATITPLPMKLRDQLVTRKRAELVHEQPVLFRKKLAFFLGRDAEDVPESQKGPPPPPSAT